MSSSLLHAYPCLQSSRIHSMVRWSEATDIETVGMIAENTGVGSPPPPPRPLKFEYRPIAQKQSDPLCLSDWYVVEVVIDELCHGVQKIQDLVQTWFGGKWMALASHFRRR